MNQSSLQLLLILLVLAFALIRVQNYPEGMLRAPLINGIKLRFNRSESTFGLIVGVLVALALFVAIDPEARVFLVFLDSFGVDLFIALCALFVRHNLELCAAILLIPILKGIYRWGPVPGFWPSRVVLRSSVSWAGYAILYPAMALFMALFMAMLLVRCTLIGL
jgi:hypothetical protein